MPPSCGRSASIRNVEGGMAEVSNRRWLGIKQAAKIWQFWQMDGLLFVHCLVWCYIITPVGWVRAFSQWICPLGWGAEPVKCGRFSHNKNREKTREKQNKRQVIQFVTLDSRLFFWVGKTENFEHFGAHNRVTIRSSGHEEKLPGQVKNVFLFWIFHLNSPTKVTWKFFDETRG